MVNSIYGGKDPAEIPAYSVQEAARWLGVPISTVRAWAVGRRQKSGDKTEWYQPVIQIVDPDERLISFRNLVELHVLAGIRRQHGVSLQNVRRSVRFMSEKLSIQNPLSSREMLTDGRDLLLDHLGELINASQSGQMEMRRIVEAYLSRIHHDAEGRPARLYPFSSTQVERDRKSIVIDPRIQFGRPCISKTRLATTVVAERFEAGETIEELARDYKVDPRDVEEAIRYERLPSAA